MTVEGRLLAGRDVDGLEGQGVERSSAGLQELLREDGGEEVRVDGQGRHLGVSWK